jgi:hypothetical protein
MSHLMSLSDVKWTWLFALRMFAFDPKRTSPASIDAAFEKKDRLTAVLLKSKVTAYQCALMRIEAGWPGSLKRFRGTIFVPLTFKIERS